MSHEWLYFMVWVEMHTVWLVTGCLASQKHTTKTAIPIVIQYTHNSQTHLFSPVYAFPLPSLGEESLHSFCTCYSALLWIHWVEDSIWFPCHQYQTVCVYDWKGLSQWDSIFVLKKTTYLLEFFKKERNCRSSVHYIQKWQSVDLN